MQDSDRMKINYDPFDAFVDKLLHNSYYTLNMFFTGISIKRFVIHFLNIPWSGLTRAANDQL